NPLSAIRGHSLLRDMYGNDASTNGSLVDRPDGRVVGPFADRRFYVLAATLEQGSGPWQFRTNIPARDPAFFGYNFTPWIIPFRHQGAASPRPVDQTFEILIDDDSGASAFSRGYRVFSVSDPDGTSVLNNPTLGSVTPLVWPLNRQDDTSDPHSPFVLDG